MKEYEVHTADREDMNEGWIWIRDPELRSIYNGRRRIARVQFEGKHIHCEILYADPLDIRRFSEHFKSEPYFDEPPAWSLPEHKASRLIFINAWYRKLLGMPSGLPKTLKLEITESRSFWQYFRACFQHPQQVVVAATALAFVGLGLGVIGVGLGVIGIKDWLKDVLDVPGLANVKDLVIQVALYVAVLLIAMGVIVSLIGVAPLLARARRARL